MYASRTLAVSSLSFVLALAGLTGASRAASLSDRLVIVGTAGVPIFDNSIQEPAASTAPETSLTFNGGPLPGPLPPITSPVGLSLVVLTEPAGSVPEPGEAPLILSTPSGDLFVSDVLVASTQNLPPGIAPFITLLSDGDPNLQALLPLIQANFAALNPHVIAETGQLQDVTQLLYGPVASPFGPVQVLVQSDAPEPAVILLLGSGLAGLAFARARRRA